MHPDDETFGRRFVHYVDPLILGVFALLFVVFILAISGWMFTDDMRHRGSLPTVSSTEYNHPAPEPCDYSEPATYSTRNQCP